MIHQSFSFFWSWEVKFRNHHQPAAPLMSPIIEGRHVCSILSTIIIYSVVGRFYCMESLLLLSISTWKFPYLLDSVSVFIVIFAIGLVLRTFSVDLILQNKKISGSQLARIWCLQKKRLYFCTKIFEWVFLSESLYIICFCEILCPSVY